MPPKIDPFASNDSIDRLMQQLRQENRNFIQKVEKARTGVAVREGKQQIVVKNSSANAPSSLDKSHSHQSRSNKIKRSMHAMVLEKHRQDTTDLNSSLQSPPHEELDDSTNDQLVGNDHSAHQSTFSNNTIVHDEMAPVLDSTRDLLDESQHEVSHQHPTSVKSLSQQHKKRSASSSASERYATATLSSKAKVSSDPITASSKKTHSTKRSTSTKRPKSQPRRATKERAPSSAPFQSRSTTPRAQSHMLSPPIRDNNPAPPLSPQTQVTSLPTSPTDPVSMKRIKVSVRMRPPHRHESISNNIHISPLTNQIQLRNKNFTFDHVFSPSAHQETVYNTMSSDLIRDVTKGINATLLAYGQTGAGKTFTTLGSLGQAVGKGSSSSSATAQGNPRHASLDGVVPRAIRDLFARLNEERSHWPKYRVWVSYMQIYMEVIHDLLSSSARTKRQQFLGANHTGHLPNSAHHSMSASSSLSASGTGLPFAFSSTPSTPTNSAGNSLGAGLAIREENGRIYVEGLSKHRVRSFEDVMKILDYGERARMTAQTKLNQESSRSHTLFQIHIERRHAESGKIIRSTFTCCDLAGSERQNSGSRSGGSGGLNGNGGDHADNNNAFHSDDHHHSATRSSHHHSDSTSTPTFHLDQHSKSRLFEEAKFINLSLSALGNVIHTLQQNKRNAFIPWRDSKLTRVLQPTLSGNSRVSLIVNIGPDDSYIQESLTSLSFGQRAMQVSVKPQINEELDYKTLAITLQKQLDEVQSAKNFEIQELVERNQSLEEQIGENQSDMEKLQLNLQDTLAEKDKYHTWYQSATDKNLTLMKLLKKRKDRISHLDKFVSIVGESPKHGTDSGGFFGGTQTSLDDSFSDPVQAQSPSSSRMALLDREAQDFITKEREHFRAELQRAKEKNRSLSDKLNLTSKNSSSLNETVAYLTEELEKQGKLAETYRKRLKQYKKSTQHVKRDLRQLDVILCSLIGKHIVGGTLSGNGSGTPLQRIAADTLSRLFPDISTSEDHSLLFLNDECFSVAPVQVALTALLDQVLEREKTIEVLVQKTRLLHVEHVAQQKLQEHEEAIRDLDREYYESSEQGGSTSQANSPATPSSRPHRHTTPFHSTSTRKTPSLRNSPQLFLPKSLKKFQRWNRIQESINEAKHKLPHTSYFARFDFETHLKSNVLLSLKTGHVIDAEDDDDLDGTLSNFVGDSDISSMDPFTQVMINIDHKYATVRDHLDDLRHRLIEKDLRISELETLCESLTQKNQILSRQVRLDQDEKSHMRNQIHKLRMAVQDLEQFGDLTRQNVELSHINRDLEHTNIKLEQQLHEVQEKLHSGASIHSALSGAISDLSRSVSQVKWTPTRSNGGGAAPSGGSSVTAPPPDARPKMYNLLYGGNTNTPSETAPSAEDDFERISKRFSKSMPSQLRSALEDADNSDLDKKTNISLPHDKTTATPHHPGTFGPVLSKPEQQPSMKSLKKHTSPLKERPVLSELHPYPESTHAAKQLRRTHGHSTMEKQSPVRKRPLIISSDIGNGAAGDDSTTEVRRGQNTTRERSQSTSNPKKKQITQSSDKNLYRKSLEKDWNQVSFDDKQQEESDSSVLNSPWTSLSSIEADKFIEDDDATPEEQDDTVVITESEEHVRVEIKEKITHK